MFGRRRRGRSVYPTLSYTIGRDSCFSGEPRPPSAARPLAGENHPAIDVDLRWHSTPSLAHSGSATRNVLGKGAGNNVAERWGARATVLLQLGCGPLAMFLPSWSGRLLLKELEMPPVHFSATLIAIALWMAPCFTGTLYAAREGEPAAAVAQRRDAASAQAQSNAGDEDWRNSLTATLANARALLQAGYERAPALVIALGAFVVLPAAAVFSLSVQSAARRRRRRAAVHAAERRASVALPDTDMPVVGDVALWPSEAWLTVEGGADGTLPLSSRLIRIGRHQDNDVRLPDTSVHRYHAVIERTLEEAFVITDLSGKDGNGVRINGERLSRAQLTDGDVIELGRTRLKFESAQA